MSRTNFTGGGGEEFFLISSPRPRVWGKAWVLGRDRESMVSTRLRGISIRWVDIFQSRAASLEHFRPAKLSGLCGQPGFYLRLEAYGFIGSSEGDYSGRRDSIPQGRASLALSQRLSLEPGRLKAFSDPDQKRRSFRFGADLPDGFRRLGVSLVRDRSELLSSIGIRSAQPACALRSSGPSRGRRPARSNEHSRA
jgi:hypothetical protein